jgi:hypothetical protein
MIRREALFVAALLPSLASCIGTTGSDLFTFDAAAAGPADAVAGQPLSFTSGRGDHVTLTRALVHIGAVYLNKATPVSGAQATSCVLPGIYVAQVTHGLTVDALSPAPQPFPGAGEAIADTAIAGEVWLTGGDVNAEDDPTVILDIAGTVEKGGAEIPFDGLLTISQNRARQISDPAQPGAHPICKERIVSPIPVHLAVRSGGSLLVRVDPRQLFTNVDFSAFPEAAPGEPPAYHFEDVTEGQPSVNIYRGLGAHEGTYEILWNSVAR